MHAWMWAATCVLLIISIMILRLRESTCVLLYGASSDWTAFIQGVRSVIPAAEVLVLRNPETDFAAYADAFEDCSGRFRNLICQVPNARVGQLIRDRRATTVCVASQPSMMQPNVTCNIVASEQALVDTIQKLVPKLSKVLVLSESTLRVPKGWTQLQVGVDDAIQQLSGVRLDGIVVSKPELATTASLASLKVAYPNVMLAGVTATDDPVDQLDYQICVDKVGVGRLAAGMCRMVERTGPYRGQQTIVTDPVVVKPSKNLERPLMVKLSSLKRLLG